MDFGLLLGSAIGASISAAGGVATNNANIANQQAINQDNIALQYALNADQVAVAQMNNQTAIDLANTAHQREVRDLRDAGLNPILSSHGSGASSPTLQAPSLTAPRGNAVTQDNPLKEFGASARDIGRAFSRQADQEAAIRNQQIASTDIVIDALEAEKDASKASANADRLEAENRQERALYEREAYDELRNRGAKPNQVLGFDRQMLDLAKEGIISDMKNRANANLRNWIPLMSQGASGANSAAGAIRRFGNLIKFGL